MSAHIEEQDIDLEKSRERQEPHEPYESESDEHRFQSHDSNRYTSSYIYEGPDDFPQVEKTESRLSRIGTAGLERANSTLSTIRSRRPVPPFSHPLTKEKTKPDVLVDFDGPDDPYRPLNWAFKKKVWTTALYGFTTMGATFSSSVYSSATEAISDQYHVGVEVSTLGTALFLFAFGLGPLVWAPLSEVYGRRKAVLIPYFIAGCFAFATGVSKDIQSICITR